MGAFLSAGQACPASVRQEWPAKEPAAQGDALRSAIPHCVSHLRRRGGRSVPSRPRSYVDEADATSSCSRAGSAKRTGPDERGVFRPRSSPRIDALPVPVSQLEGGARPYKILPSDLALPSPPSLLALRLTSHVSLTAAGSGPYTSPARRIQPSSSSPTTKLPHAPFLSAAPPRTRVL